MSKRVDRLLAALVAGTYKEPTANTVHCPGLLAAGRPHEMTAQALPAKGALHPLAHTLGRHLDPSLMNSVHAQSPTQTLNHLETT